MVLQTTYQRAFHWVQTLITTLHHNQATPEQSNPIYIFRDTDHMLKLVHNTLGNKFF